MSRAAKTCGKDLGAGQFCYNDAAAGKRHCADCGNTRWPTDQPERSDRSDSSHMQQLRWDVIAKAEGHCEIRYAGVCTDDANELDHIVPHFEGGSDTDVNNFQAACAPCHSAKSSDEGHRAQGHRVKPREILPRHNAGAV